MPKQPEPLRVLHIEDQDDDAVLVGAELRRAGYDVQAQRVETTAALQQALFESAWDVVLADYSLPGFDAPAALEIMRQSGQDIPFLIVSGTIREEQAVTALRAGAQDFITKGNLARLAPAIERELREAENRRQRRRAEVRLTATMDALLEGAQIIGFDWRYLYVNDAAADQGRRAKDELVGLTMEQAYPGIEQTPLFATLGACMAERVARRLVNEFTYPGGATGWFELSIEPVPEGLFILSRDITERVQAEAALRESEERFRLLVEGVRDYAIYMLDPHGRVVSWNVGAERIKGYRADEIIGQDFSVFFTPEERAAGAPAAALRTATQQGSAQTEGERVRKDGSRFWAQVVMTAVHNGRGQQVGFAKITRDITERRQADAQIRRQLDRLGALRAIDLAITSNLDMQLTLSVFLQQVLSQQRVDAADVLLLDPNSQTLRYAAGRGFRSNTFEHVQLRLGEGRAGRAALERRIVTETATPLIPTSRRTGLLAQDEFICYHGVPLVAKGQVLGVLEVFDRTRREPDPEWLGFLEALAGQAAIAIENAALFEGLQRSHQELALAYDATIEGWSRALDLRDKETEGHSQRVTELTLIIARALAVSEAELVHIRRGALLHDMGKLGIPDRILLKPGTLTDDEWEIMRQHPTYAYEMLSPIAYLRPALDIPYCHHEKWDGTGYPRGLMGEQIPLAARIFAVVDVYDALRSDRPYRPAWPAERILVHIKSMAGTHFELRMVDVFFQSVA